MHTILQQLTAVDNKNVLKSYITVLINVAGVSVTHPTLIIAYNQRNSQEVGTGIKAINKGSKVQQSEE